eukprot:gene9130-23239_t
MRSISASACSALRTRCGEERSTHTPTSQGAAAAAAPAPQPVQMESPCRIKGPHPLPAPAAPAAAAPLAAPVADAETDYRPEDMTEDEAKQMGAKMAIDDDEEKQHPDGPSGEAARAAAQRRAAHLPHPAPREGDTHRPQRRRRPAPARAARPHPTGARRP